MKQYKIGVVGGSGYGGSELLRLLHAHPAADVTLVTAHTHAHKRVDEVHPSLRGFTDLVFAPTTVTEAWDALDFLFLAVPHGQSMGLLPQISKDLAMVDLTGDYRLLDQQVFEDAYKRKHSSFGYQSQFVYGLTEVNHCKIKGAHRVSNPGCFATATTLGLYPLVKAGVLDGKVIVDAKTGSSGSGASPKAGTHHPKRANSFYAYKPFTHQHVPEVLQTLHQVNPAWEGNLVFQTHSAPMVRGIFASIYTTLQQELSPEEVAALFADVYGDAPFVRCVPGSPDVNWVKGTNFADIGWFQRGKDLNIFVAIDNLVKGASGQAIQNMNLMLGLEEHTGLMFPGSHP